MSKTVGPSLINVYYFHYYYYYHLLLIKLLIQRIDLASIRDVSTMCELKSIRFAVNSITPLSATRYFPMA